MVPTRPSSRRPGSGSPASSSDTVRIGVLGAGVMGGGIAQVTAIAGYETVCYDVARRRRWRKAASTSPPVASGSTARSSAGKLTRDEADAALERV